MGLKSGTPFRFMTSENLQTSKDIIKNWNGSTTVGYVRVELN